ncbi:hypothetical protein ACYJA9_001227 [Campylobacter upsaliensis]|uniref:Uncharacterized protein n=2 Tax=Campylobacter upsaliensis TaxID=28080 RepID=A0A7U8G8S9_CAMUP|nr:hypothetical protein [Campylobacter upsaliensis]EAI4101348.1 hypothetical protein [Campylobacter jejuni]EAH9136015.1 hypothetical protein [Campylobacter upsaliensis]EAH9147379.1 hypothetical protein [Campylobacter upsaliensis]EAI4331065.1 hypothetical protein [Campylobacter upsaliensis]EAI4357857.1 hypothetical protein [Campylobacter upsaliensis]
MILAKIYPFARKDIKMKLDKIKEEIANIRRTQNMFATILIAVLGYFFTAKGIGEIRAFGAMFSIVLLSIILSELNDKMKKKLNELEQLKKDE